MSDHWLLPENIADVLPSEARKIEELRRRMLDLFRTYGYELVMPPMMESHGVPADRYRPRPRPAHAEAGGSAREDSGPARGHHAAGGAYRCAPAEPSRVTRLCYAGNVLHARPAGFHATREPIQIGAEIYGHAGLEADVEIQELMLAALRAAGLSGIRLDLCHAGIPALLEGLPSGRKIEADLFAALETRTCPRCARSRQACRRPSAMRCWRCRRCTVESRCWSARARIAGEPEDPARARRADLPRQRGARRQRQYRPG